MENIMGKKTCSLRWNKWSIKWICIISELKLILMLWDGEGAYVRLCGLHRTWGGWKSDSQNCKSMSEADMRQRMIVTSLTNPSESLWPQALISNRHHQCDWVHPCGLFKYFPARLSLLNTQFNTITLASAYAITGAEARGWAWATVSVGRLLNCSWASLSIHWMFNSKQPAGRQTEKAKCLLCLKSGKHTERVGRTESQT